MFAIRIIGSIGVAYLSIWGRANPEQLLEQASDDSDPISPVQVEVRVTRARSDRGAVLALLFENSEGFPNHPERAVDRARSVIVDGDAHLVFRMVRSGSYAVVVIHDENNNQTLDTNFLGIPKEGVGVSNNPETRLGPPRYRDAKFLVEHRDLKKRIVLKYL